MRALCLASHEPPGRKAQEGEEAGDIGDRFFFNVSVTSFIYNIYLQYAIPIFGQKIRMERRTNIPNNHKVLTKI